MRLAAMRLLLAATLPPPTEAVPRRKCLPPQIITSALDETTIVPNWGQICFAAEIHASTVAAADTENAQCQMAAIDAIRAEGVQQEHITTYGYPQPEKRYDKGKRMLVGYIARISAIQEALSGSRLDSIITSARLAAGTPDTPVSVGEQKVTASVTVCWVLVPTR